VKLSTRYRDIVRLAAPISLSLLVPQFNFFANTAFLGRLGPAAEQALGVNALAGVFYLALSMIGYGLSSGIGIQLSRRAGEGDAKGIAQLLGNGVLLTLAFSLILMMLSLWTAPFIFGFSLSDSDRAFRCIEFLYIRVWGLPFLMLTQLCNAYFLSIGRSRNLMVASTAATVINIVLDYFLILGNGGFPQLGLPGAAYASILAELGGFIAVWGIFYYRQHWREYPIHRYFRFDPVLAKRMMIVSSPLIMQFLFSIGGWQVFFILVEHLGTAELAASQLLRSVFGILGIVTWAFATATSTLVSNIIAQGRTKDVQGVIWKIAKLSFGSTFCISALLLLFSGPFLRIYGADDALIALAVPSLQVIMVAALIMSVSTIVFNGVVGTGNTRINLIIEIVCVSSYLVYCAVVIEHLGLPLQWAWASEFVYWGSLLIISFAYLRSGRWKGKKV
jgi:putative MATE family efflux protein